MAATTIDFAPLTAPMPEEAVRAWKAQAKASGAPWASVQTGSILAVVFMIPFAVIMVVVAFAFGAIVFSSAAESGSVLALIFPLVIMLGVIAIIAFAVVKGIGAIARRWEVWARMDGFARANGLTFSPLDSHPDYPGAIFRIGDTRQAVDHLRSSADPTDPSRFFDLGNYRYSTGSGKNRSTHTWGFLAFHLDRRLPNMVLDSRANNGFFGTNLPATFSKDQILPLEGDFDRYFTLYAPQEYERDALYVFTPDLMALLIDEAAPFDVEIVDDWMFVYSSVAFRTGDANMYARLFRIIDTVGAKTLTQTDRYVDERIGEFAANIVAPAGARLKRRVSVASVIVAAVVVGFWVWGIIGDVVGR
jgi:hypothetical protein